MKVKTIVKKKFLLLTIGLFASVFLLLNSSRTTKGQSASFSFSVLGDLGGNSRSDATLAAMSQNSADFSYIVGDLSYAEKTPESAWCDYVKSYLGTNYPFELLVGNHEDDGGPDGWIDNFANCLPDRLGSVGSYGKQYFTDYPAADPIARFIMISPDLDLDGEHYDYSLGTARYNWVASTIDQAKAAGIQWIIVGTHKVCLTIGVKSCEISQDLVNLLVEKRVDVVVQGHEHNYERSKVLAHNVGCTSVPVGSYNPNCVADDGTGPTITKGLGTIFLIVGNAGRSNYDLDPTSPEAGYFTTWAGDIGDQVNGFALFNASTDQLTMNFIPSVGTYTDSFTIVENGYSPTPTPTPAPTQTITVPVSEDVTLKSESPSTNYGDWTSLEVDGSPAQDFLLKFDVSGINGKQVVESKLSLYNINNSSSGGNFYSISNLWDELSVTWDSSPAANTLVSSLGPVSPGNWYDTYVTDYINGDGQYSFRVSSTSSDGADYSSREDLGLAPYLTITYEDASASATPSPSPTPTPTPTPTSTPTPTPTPTAPPTVLSFNPVDDASIYLNSPNNNYGSWNYLETDNHPVKDFLLKFSVSGIGTSSVSGVKLRLYITNSSNDGGDIRLSSDNNWSESNVNWNTAPLATTDILANFGSVSRKNWVEVDLTPHITTDGVYTLRISSTARNGADYSSKEGSNPPQLIVETN